MGLGLGLTAEVDLEVLHTDLLVQRVASINPKNMKRTNSSEILYTPPSCHSGRHQQAPP